MEEKETVQATHEWVDDAALEPLVSKSLAAMVEAKEGLDKDAATRKPLSVHKSLADAMQAMREEDQNG